MAIKAEAKPPQMPADRYGWYVVALMCGILLADYSATVFFFGLILGCAVALRLIAFIMLSLSFPVLPKILLIWCAIGGAASAFEQARLAKPLISEIDKVSLAGVIDKAERQAGHRWRFFIREPIIDGQLFDGRVRVISDYPRAVLIKAGDRIAANVTLFPLTLPLFAGWPDYRRKAWREGVIATAYGYRIPIYKQTTADETGIASIRQSLVSQIEQDLSPQAALIGKAMFTGTRDFQDSDIITAFRHSGLSHLLAISGLHMSLFCFGVYLFARLIFALREDILGRITPHKLAALLALASGLFYLGPSGAPLSAMRAFGLAVIIMLAILLDRHLITMRNLHLIALLFLLLSPSTLYFPAAQLSFAATYGIVACLATLRGSPLLKRTSFLMRGFCYLSVSSCAAFITTAPIALYHFGFIAPLGLFANLLAIPLTGFVIMPLFLAYLLLAPLSATSIIAPLMDTALQCLIFIAASTASFKVLAFLKPPHGLFLPVLFITCFALYQAGWQRYVGVAGLVVVIGVWAIIPRPQAVLWLQAQETRFVLQQEGVRWQTATLSPFWQSTLDRLLGKAQSTITYHCRTICLIPFDKREFVISRPGYDVDCERLSRQIRAEANIFLRSDQDRLDCPNLTQHRLDVAREPRAITITKDHVTITERATPSPNKAWIAVLPNSHNGG